MAFLLEKIMKHATEKINADEIHALVDNMSLDLAASRKVCLDLMREKDRLLKIMDDLKDDFDRILKGDK